MEQSRKRPNAVYPRSRGEHGGTPVTALGSDGLSPLSRGTRRAEVDDVREFRFIPALAGNTQSWMTLAAGISVYPRSRGEHAQER